MIESISEGDKPTFLIIGPTLLLVTFFLPWLAGFEIWNYDDDPWTDDIIGEVPSANGWDFLKGDSGKMQILTILTIIPAGLFLADKYRGFEQLSIGCFAGIVLLDLAIVLDILDAASYTETLPIGIGWFLNFILASFFGYVSYNAYVNPDTGQVPQTLPPSHGDRPRQSYVKNAPMFPPAQEQITVECPVCNAQMDIPKLGEMQTVTCKICGLSMEVKV